MTPPLLLSQVFDLGNHYLQSSSQKLLTGGAAGAGALTLGTTAGPLTTMEIKVGAVPAAAGGGSGRCAAIGGRCGDALAGEAQHTRSRVLRTALCAGLLPQAVKGMPSEAVIGRWKETVRELGNILVQVREGRQRAV